MVTRYNKLVVDDYAKHLILINQPDNARGSLDYCRPHVLLVSPPLFKKPPLVGSGFISWFLLFLSRRNHPESRSLSGCRESVFLFKVRYPENPAYTILVGMILRLFVFYFAKIIPIRNRSRDVANLFFYLRCCIPKILRTLSCSGWFWDYLFFILSKSFALYQSIFHLQIKNNYTHRTQAQKHLHWGCLCRCLRHSPALMFSHSYLWSLFGREYNSLVECNR